jgi:hypothetical protein
MSLTRLLPRHWSVACLAFVLLHALTSAFSARGGEIEAIQSFLSNPKPIESYLYQLDGDETEGSLNVVRGRWAAEATNWAQYLTTTNPSPQDRFGAFAGRVGDLFWEAHDGKLTRCVRSSNPRTTTMVILGAQGDRSARMLLRLGLPDIDFPRATWNGPYFSANATSSKFTRTEKSYAVAGEISQVSEGRFQIVVTNLETGQMKTKVLAAYTGPVTDSSIPASLQIDEIVHKPDMPVIHLSNYISLIEVRRPSKTLAPELFAPEKLEELGRKFVSFYSNDVQYAVSPHDARLHLPTMTTKEAQAQREARARSSDPTAFRVLVLLLVILPLAFLGWQTLKNKTTKEQNKTTTSTHEKTH